jgi:hypothetical protein
LNLHGYHGSNPNVSDQVPFCRQGRWDCLRAGCSSEWENPIAPPGKRANRATLGRRPKAVAEVLELARQHGAEAIDRIVSLMRSKNDAVALRAAEALLDRGYGRPRQAVAVQHEQPVQITFHRADTQKEEIPILRAEFADDESFKVVFRSSRQRVERTGIEK